MNIVFDDLQPVRRAPMQWIAADIGQRYRNTDPGTSKDAASAANKPGAIAQRAMILAELQAHPDGWTGKELAHRLRINYHSVQRRISEVQGIRRNGLQREGCAVWVAIETA